MQKFIKLISVILIVINFGCEESQNEVFTPEFKENIKARVDNGINAGIVVGVITPKGTSFYSYGVMSKETKEPVDEHTVFEIGSISKTFTGILLANEVVNGELSIDDPLQNFLPEGITAPTRNGEQIKLVNLANHTSSLPRAPDNYTPTHPKNRYANLTVQHTYDFLNTYELPYDIGSKFLYSNLGTGLLGNVLAAKNKTDYEGLMVEKIAKPLGMGDTKITLTSNMEKRLATGHRVGVEVDNWELPGVQGAGAIRSTAEDMLKYLGANMGIIESELYPAMQLSHKYSGGGNDVIKAGLGWFTMNVEGVDVVWHDGGTGGYMSFAGFTKDGKMGVVVLTNSTGFPDDIGFHLLNPKSPLENLKPSIANKLNKTIIDEGIDWAIKAYEELKENHPQKYDIKEHDMNRLGYRYLGYKKFPEALAIFKITLEAFPESWSAHDSYAEALMKNKQNELAVKHYKKSIELNPENYAGIKKLKKLGVNIESSEK